MICDSSSTAGRKELVNIEIVYGPLRKYIFCLKKLNFLGNIKRPIRILANIAVVNQE
jgi:hypothetical protein